MIASYKDDRKVQYLQVGRKIISKTGKIYEITGRYVSSNVYGNGNDVILQLDNSIGSENCEISIDRNRLIPVVYDKKLDEIEKGLELKDTNKRIAEDEANAKQAKEGRF